MILPSFNFWDNTVGNGSGSEGEYLNIWMVLLWHLFVYVLHYVRDPSKRPSRDPSCIVAPTHANIE